MRRLFERGLPQAPPDAPIVGQHPSELDSAGLVHSHRAVYLPTGPVWPGLGWQGPGPGGPVAHAQTSRAGSVAPSQLVEAQRFNATVADGGRGRLLIFVPFDPNQTWSVKPRHHVTGTVDGMGLRGVLERRSDGYGFTLGPAWARGCGVDVGDTVAVVLLPEGPQRDDLAADVAGALAANPQAGAFFDSLAQFYRRAYLSWIDATKRSPAKRAERITQMIKLLDAGIKQRPNS